MLKSMPVREARRVIRQTVRDAGYAFWEGGDYPNSIMTADLNHFGASEHTFVLSCGCAADLPQAVRDRLWKENGERLYALLKARGFQPDPNGWGKDQRRVFTVRIKK